MVLSDLDRVTPARIVTNVTGWGELRADLRRLRRDEPGALVAYPDPDSNLQRDTPISVALAAWATDIATELHERHGGTLDLQVGAISFPDRTLSVGHQVRELHGEPAESMGLAVEPARPLTVPSGRAAKVLVTVANNGDETRVLGTNGHLQTAVVDAAGSVVGRYVGAQNLPLVQFEIPPGRSREVPALVGTDSVVPELGYAVPAGEWRIVVELQTHEAKLISRPLPLTVTTGTS